MRKPDDDLKIDISELFGGDMPGPSETLEETPVVKSTEAAQPQAPPTPPAEAENEFQEWMKSRNQELELKAQELERRLQELQQSQQAPPPPPPIESLSAKDFQSETALPKAETADSSDSPIDFSAPIAPPFMGPVVPEAPASTPQAVEGGQATETADPQDAEALKRLQADHEFLMLYDEFRNIIAHELKDLVGDRKTFTMLGRTVEMAREKYPEIFRNANWDAEGNLLSDGSVDSQRIIENKNALDPKKADAAVDAALSALLVLRLQAVEKGLGGGLKNKVRARMYQWINEKIQKADRDGRDAAFLRRLSSYIA